MTDTQFVSSRKDALAGAELTIREISDQPAIWREAAAKIETQRDEIEAFLAPLMQRADLRVVLTGAGTSAFAGGVAAPALARLLGRRFEAVSTTDIVSSPGTYLAENIPTLLVSFARSGNSPESVAATRLADEVLTDVHHLVVTCDPSGALYREHAGRRSSLVLVMPAGANDQGFAMTSSFTSMLLSALLVFSRSPRSVEELSAAAETIIASSWDRIERLALGDVRRVVYLGSGPLTALAREATLKLLELTAGAMVSYHDSALGFRHGPKAVLDDYTLAVVFMSSDAYTGRYDTDMAEELRGAISADRVLTVSAGSSTDENSLAFEGLAGFDDAYLAVVFSVVAQILALSFALREGTTPDNPFPGGQVNRVVKGVEIYPLAADLSERPR